MASDNSVLFQSKETPIFVKILQERISPFQQIAVIYSFLVYGCLNVFDFTTIWKGVFYGFLLIFAFGTIFLNWKRMPIHSRILSLVLILGGGALYFVTDTFLVLLISACGACLIGMPLEKILRTGFYTQLAFFLFIVFLSFFGLGRENDLPPFEGSLRGYRFSLGFSHPNAAASFFLFTMMLYIASAKKLNTPKIALCALSCLIVYGLTNSKTMLVFDVLFFAVLLFWKLFVLPKRLVSFGCLLFPFFLAVGYVLCSFFYDTSLNDIMTGRLWLGHDAMMTGLTLFGNDITYPVDMMYMNLLYNDGIVITLFYFAVFSLPFLYIAKYFNDSYRTLFFLFGALTLVYGLSETYAQNLMAPTTIVFFYWLYNGKDPIRDMEDRRYLDNRSLKSFLFGRFFG